ncbi:YetF domain-containing protein [Oceanobacillus kapialis]|uniref:YetF domain-containing protein n=1 Tax=Oceanobacillus kapialis TaxID=481353 RepID=A0ABW5PVN4_9BACI
MDINELTIRVIIGFFVLLIMTRWLGRKEISQMTFLNFTSAIAIGSITANLVVNQNLSILNGVLAIVGWAVITYILGIVELKSKKARKVISGTPVVVIKEGKLVNRSLQSSRLDLDSFNALLRQKNIFSIAEVDYAILETNGKVTVLPKDNKKPVTKVDMNIPVTPKAFPIPTEVISDGRILTENLNKLKLDTDWIQQQLQQQNITSISEVLFGQVQTDGTLFLALKS